MRGKRRTEKRGGGRWHKAAMAMGHLARRAGLWLAPDPEGHWRLFSLQTGREAMSYDAGTNLARTPGGAVQRMPDYRKVVQLAARLAAGEG